MMELPKFVSLKDYEKAVIFEGRWRPGQRCTSWPMWGIYNDGSEDGEWRCGCGTQFTNGNNKLHDIPPPQLTDELLMAMLQKGAEHVTLGWFFVCILKATEEHINLSLDAAIILAAASMEPK